MQRTTLGPYLIDRELDSGGRGKVYAATGADGAIAALKVIHMAVRRRRGCARAVPVRG